MMVAGKFEIYTHPLAIIPVLLSPLLLVCNKPLSDQADLCLLDVWHIPESQIDS